MHPLPAVRLFALAVLLALGCAASVPSSAQQSPPPPNPRLSSPGGPPPGGVQSATTLLKPFDQDKNGRLDTAERKAARDFLANERAAGRGPRRPGPPGGGGPGRRGGPGAASEATPTTAGRALTPKDVSLHPDAPLFEESVLRTFFLDFESPDWESELADFYHTDVEVPAKLTVDGRELPGVGVHFRGASSFFTIGPGHKRSINLTLDHSRKDQRLLGVKTLNLLNSHTDPTYLRSMLYYHVAREYMPAPRANLVRLVINGESWGVYVCAEQVNADFLKNRFKSSEGNRWKVPGSPRGRGSLAYLGDDPAEYRRIYDLKSKENPKAWADLIRLCKTLEQTPTDRLEAALAPILDLEGTLRFLALENVFINNDGYWIRTSDFHLFQSPDGRFHLMPHDANETFRGVEGFGGGGGGGGNRPQGIALAPLAGLDEPGKPLLSKLLAVPALRQRYLEIVRDMSETWLDWNRLGPLVSRWHTMIDEEVRTDVHKLYSHAAFRAGLAGGAEGGAQPGPRQGRTLDLKEFAESRRAYLRDQLKVAGLPKP